MIWLVKTREKAITDGNKNTKSYLKDCMIPADRYIKKIKAGNIKSDIKNDANYHLYQLMELYIDCKIISKWLSLQTDDERLDFFLHFTDINYLQKLCDFTDSYCSPFEYNSFSDALKNAITTLFTDYISDFKKAFQECVDALKNNTDTNDLNKIDAISSFLSFYINQGAWTALRIVPTTLCAFDSIQFQGKKYINYDYIKNPIMTFNEKFILEPVFDNRKFYSDAARDCFIYFLTLAKKVYDSEIETRLDKLETAVEELKRNDLEISNTLQLLTQFMNESINKKNENKKITIYQKLSHEELVNCFYDYYKVPRDFLDIIQTYPFEGKIILSKDFKIAYNYQTLIITYLDRFVNNRKDMDLIKILFHIKSKNPAASKTKYKNKLDLFKDFIKTHTKYE